MSAFAEVEALRSTIDGLRTRLTGLESVLVAAFGRLAQDEGRCAEVNAALQGRGGGQAAGGYGMEHDGGLHAQNAVGLTFGDGASVLPDPHHHHAHHHPQGDIFVHPASSSSGLTPYAPGTSAAYPPYPPLHPHQPPHAHHQPSGPSSPSRASASVSPSFGGLDGSASSSHTTAFTLPPLELATRAAGAGEEHFAFPPVGHAVAEGSAQRQGQGQAQEGGVDSGSELHHASSRERSDELRDAELAASESLEFMVRRGLRCAAVPLPSADLHFPYPTGTRAQQGTRGAAGISAELAGASLILAAT